MSRQHYEHMLNGGRVSTEGNINQVKTTFYQAINHAGMRGSLRCNGCSAWCALGAAKTVTHVP